MLCTRIDDSTGAGGGGYNDEIRKWQYCRRIVKKNTHIHIERERRFSIRRMYIVCVTHYYCFSYNLCAHSPLATDSSIGRRRCCRVYTWQVRALLSFVCTCLHTRAHLCTHMRGTVSAGEWERMYMSVGCYYIAQKSRCDLDKYVV